MITGVTARVNVAAECARAQALGAVVVAPPVETPNGRRAVVRHPDGSVFEYVGLSTG